MHTENTLNSAEIQSEKSNDLLNDYRRICAANPKTDMSQTRIAREMNRTQAAVSIALNNPAALPVLADRIRRYLSRIESRSQNNTKKSASGYYSAAENTTGA